MKPFPGAVVAGFVLVLTAACGSEDAPDQVVESTVTTTRVAASSATDAASTTDAVVATATSPPPPASTLADCADVDPIPTGVLGVLGPAPNPDPLYLGVIATYAAEHADVSGGYWIDRDSGGTIVLAVTDDPVPHVAALGARSPQPTDVAMMEPRPEIIDTSPLAERDETFDVVQVAFTEADMIAAVPAVMTALQSVGIDGAGAGADFSRNRVSILASGIVAADLPDLAAKLVDVVPLDMVCVDGVLDALPPAIEPGTALQAIVVPDADGNYPPETPVECGGIGGFTLGDLQAMLPLATAGLDGLPEAVAATLESLGGSDLIDVSRANVLQDDGETVTVISFTDTGFDAYGWFERTHAGWKFLSGGTGGPCDLRLQPPAGTGRVDWTFDTAYAAPAATDTEVHVLVNEQSCNDDRAVDEWLLGPQIVITTDAVRIAFAEIPLNSGQEMACSGSSSPTAVTVTLPEPVGDRPVVDGLVIGPPSAFVD